MILDTVKVPWLPQTYIENEANDLLNQWEKFLRVPRIRRPFGKLPREDRGLPFIG